MKKENTRKKFELEIVGRSVFIWFLFCVRTTGTKAHKEIMREGAGERFSVGGKGFPRDVLRIVASGSMGCR